ncbi:MAG: D-glycero-alpha-D-manno-heptose-7-phosphate kinase [Parcubacteria group bacterium Gr01-1014_19]|nr:MAG: D-glycero-alpha-D-manno-heptose-7-phosphate kinase [Parcubacteria group bacterium Gr01-1014_19]
MIITRTPFRVTLGGGGTDLPSYYEKYGGFIFSAGLDKYMYITVNRALEDDLIRLKYSKTETVERVDQLEHGIAREALRMMGIDKKIEISSVADVSAGTGLGSSSCYAVGVLNALHTLRRDYVSLQQIAEEDFKLENQILKRPIGKQDPYLAAFGGLTVLDIAKDGKVKVRKASVSEATAADLNHNLLLFFTGVTRSADTILKEQSTSVKDDKKSVVDSMNYIKELGYEILEAVESDNISEVGRLFDAHWQHKKKISSKMSNPQFDKIYKDAKANGALGGKISGAGGGGFFTFYVESDHAKFREAMKKWGLKEMRYNFDHEGSKVLVDL